MDTEKEKNTIQFFKELKSDSCDIELLYNLSLKGIYLYEPLFRYKNVKYHEYVIDISLMNNQYFKIYNDKQYERFIHLYKKYDDKQYERFFHLYKKNDENSKGFTLLLLNEYIVNKLVNDNINYDVLKYLDDYSNLPLYYLLKYNHISYKILDFFKSDDLPYDLIIYMVFVEMFYFKENINIMNINKYIDIKALEYIIYNVINNFENDYCFNYFRIKPYYPINLLNKYSLIIYKPNILYFKHPDENIEKLFNSICGDELLYLLQGETSIEDKYKLFNYYFEKYNFPKDLSNFEIINEDEYNLIKDEIKKDREDTNYYKKEDLWFCNKDLFNINHNLTKIFHLFPNTYYYSYDEVDTFATTFATNYLNDIELPKMLKNPDYIIYKSEIDSLEDNYFNNMMIRCCIIGCLIYNNESKFIISILIELTKEFLPLTYDPQENTLCFEHTENDCKQDWEEKWPEEYNELFYSIIISTSNKKFNNLFKVKYY
ncbi:hypothetical protein BCR32DRAFT_281487 [Anaeromyces robustus]|uniref:Uncharacterized protein n=1 Tax=Anaeromyces robustus TaxID=1754192 RepID=A0A1Y1X1T7_9FUNG|nr:hypothetical protein BCR32DRAFT_281487 [Anaeromyces robustus]|eukprot:ORX79376.1 hypothetical protein BCR32DRAFT_281487 [Anaeromyces robustus]